MSLFHTVESDVYGSIDIGAVALYGYANGYQIHPECDNITIIDDFDTQITALRTKNYGIDGFTFNTIRTERTEDELNESTFRVLCDNINNNTFWVWGDFYKGGVGFIFTSNFQSFYCVTSYGKLFNPNTNKYIYGFYPAQGMSGFIYNNSTLFQKTFKTAIFAYTYTYSGGQLTSPEHYSLYNSGNVDLSRGNAFGLFLGTDTTQYADRIEYVGEISGIYPSYSYRYINNGAFNEFPIDSGFLGYTYGVISTDPLQVYLSLHLVNRTFTGNPNSYFQEIPPSPYVLTDGDIWGNGTVPKQPNKKGGTSGGGGGGGKFDNTSDNDDNTDDEQFTIDALDTGFVALYSPSKTELRSLANFLYSGITDSIANQLKKLLANPLDYLVSLNMVHLPLTIAETDTIKFGAISTGVVMGRLNKQFKIYDGGYFDITEQFMTFLDYGNYSSLKISIPYCGIFSLPTNQLVGGRLTITYIVDLLTGSLVAELKIIRQRSYVKIGNETEAEQSKVIASYSGNCFLPIPIAATDYRQTINSLLGITSGLATSIATSNPLPLVGATANAVVNSKQDINMGSNLGNNYGYMTKQQAFLILENPCQNLPLNFPYFEGYPSNVRVRHLNDLVNLGGGYVELDADTFWCGSHTNGFGRITEEEAKELKTIMNGGIYIS